MNLKTHYIYSRNSFCIVWVERKAPHRRSFVGIRVRTNFPICEQVRRVYIAKGPAAAVRVHMRKYNITSLHEAWEFLKFYGIIQQRVSDAPPEALTASVNGYTPPTPAESTAAYKH